MTDETTATPEVQRARLNLAVTCIGECLTDMGRLIQQGLRDDNQALRGSIALGLERAASYVRGLPFDRPIDPQHADKASKTMGP